MTDGIAADSKEIRRGKRKRAPTCSQSNGIFIDSNDRLNDRGKKALSPAFKVEPVRSYFHSLHDIRNATIE